MSRISHYNVQGYFFFQASEIICQDLEQKIILGVFYSLFNR